MSEAGRCASTLYRVWKMIGMWSQARSAGNHEHDHGGSSLKARVLPAHRCSLRAGIAPDLHPPAATCHWGTLSEMHGLGQQQCCMSQNVFKAHMYRVLPSKPRRQQQRCQVHHSTVPTVPGTFMCRSRSAGPAYATV